ncbi:MAG TPA: hypothetical protein VIW67_07885, partial [Terriglobales bacterium]
CNASGAIPIPNKAHAKPFLPDFAPGWYCFLWRRTTSCRPTCCAVLQLLPGLGNHHHPIATKNPEAQKFFDQVLGTGLRI